MSQSETEDYSQSEAGETEVEKVEKPKKVEKQKVQKVETRGRKPKIPKEGGVIEISEEKLQKMLVLSQNEAKKLLKPARERSEKQKEATARLVALNASRRAAAEKEKPKVVSPPEEAPKVVKVLVKPKQKRTVKPRDVAPKLEPLKLERTKKAKLSPLDVSSDSEAETTETTETTEPVVRKARRRVKKAEEINNRIRQLNEPKKEVYNPFVKVFSRW